MDKVDIKFATKIVIEIPGKPATADLNRMGGWCCHNRMLKEAVCIRSVEISQDPQGVLHINLLPPEEPAQST